MTWDPVTRYEQSASEALTCRACPLHETRTQVVFGAGSLEAAVMLIGEAPGPREDELGYPFAGRSGRVLDDLLASVQLDRERVYLTNVLKCAPPGRRDPASDEIESCARYLFAQVRQVRPHVLVTLGGFATKLICRSTTGITRARGRETTVRLADHFCFALPVYSPAIVLYAPALRRVLERDFRRIPELLERELVDELAVMAAREPDEPIQHALFAAGRYREDAA